MSGEPSAASDHSRRIPRIRRRRRHGGVHCAKRLLRARHPLPTTPLGAGARVGFRPWREEVFAFEAAADGHGFLRLLVGEYAFDFAFSFREGDVDEGVAGGEAVFVVLPVHVELVVGGVFAGGGKGAMRASLESTSVGRGQFWLRAPILTPCSNSAPDRPKLRGWGVLL